MKAYVYSKSVRSGVGWRVTLGHECGPIVSLWGENLSEIHHEAWGLMRATPEPIDSILQATLWHGKAAQA